MVVKTEHPHSVKNLGTENLIIELMTTCNPNTKRRCLRELLRRLIVLESLEEDHGSEYKASFAAAINEQVNLAMERVWNHI